MSTKDLKDIPVLATKDLVVFPNTSIPLAVASSANKINVKAASEEEKLIYIVPLKDGKHLRALRLKTYTRLVLFVELNRSNSKQVVLTNSC